MDRYTTFARKNKYVLKCDIKKYFHSIDQEILMSLVSRKIRCPRTLDLIKKIVCSRTHTGSLEYFRFNLSA